MSNVLRETRKIDDRAFALADIWMQGYETMRAAKPNIGSLLSTTFKSAVGMMQLRYVQTRLARDLGVDTDNLPGNEKIFPILEELKRRNSPAYQPLKDAVDKNHAFWSDPAVKKADEQGNDMDLARAARDYRPDE